jgi:hypothetical protein
MIVMSIRPQDAVVDRRVTAKKGEGLGKNCQARALCQQAGGQCLLGHVLILRVVIIDPWTRYSMDA